MPQPPENPVRLARINAKLDQISLAQRAHIGLSTLRLAERGTVSTRTLTAIARVLGVQVHELRRAAFERRRAPPGPRGQP